MTRAQTILGVPAIRRGVFTGRFSAQQIAARIVREADASARRVDYFGEIAERVVDERRGLFGCIVDPHELATRIVFERRLDAFGRGLSHQISARIPRLFPYAALGIGDRDGSEGFVVLGADAASIGERLGHDIAEVVVFPRRAVARRIDHRRGAAQSVVVVAGDTAHRIGQHDRQAARIGLQECHAAKRIDDACFQMRQVVLEKIVVQPTIAPRMIDAPETIVVMLMRVIERQAVTIRMAHHQVTMPPISSSCSNKSRRMSAGVRQPWPAAPGNMSWLA